MEQFVAKVFQGGKVTIPKRLRELLEIGDGDYVRLGILEVMRKEGDKWVMERFAGACRGGE